MRKYRYIFLLVGLSKIICSCEEMETNNSQAGELKVYNLEIQKVNKLQELYGLISPNEVVFLDASGNKKFSIEDSQFKTDTTFKFSFTDAIGHPNGDIYVLATEIQKNNNFSLFVFRFNPAGQSVWDHPREILITNSYQYDTSALDIRYSVNFTSRENGYALATVNDNEIVSVVNYQTSRIVPWRYRILVLSENGDELRTIDYESSSFVSWTYMIDVLPDQALVIVRGSNLYLDIIQCDPSSLEKTKVYSSEGNLNFTQFSSMFSWTEDEVVFTGHADRRNNEIIAENFDILCLRYNYRTNEIADTVFSGLVNNNELSYHSYKDENNIIHCIGTKRGDLLSTPGIQSNLLEVKFNLETLESESLELIKNSGYEGLYAEPDNNALNSLNVLGYKLDISGKENIQGFFLQIKNP